ncbi:MAG TPA: hypothetical protein VJ792_03880 [Candidatus Nitrosotalea sp.]|nr:hypothetical protein [Candidatus Nitrosotalea sp.]
MQCEVRDCMYKFEESIVRLSGLKPCPCRVTMHTAKMVEEVTEAARSDPERLEPITVAVLGKETYIANGHLRAHVLGKIGHDSARAHVVHVRRVSEIVKLHIDLNTHGAINPVAMMDALSYLRQHDQKKQVSERYSSLARGLLGAKARRVVEDFLDAACKKYRTVDMPFYVIEWLVSLGDDKTQYEAARILVELARSSRDQWLVFPSPAGLKEIADSLRPRREEKEVVVLRPKAQSWPVVESKEASELVRGSPYDMIFQCKCGRKLLLNTKNRTVSSARDDKKAGCIRLDPQDGASPVFAIPGDILEFLEGDAEGLRFLKMDSKKELEKFVSSIRGGAQLRLVVILAG